jgi:hypothetical protein
VPQQSQAPEPQQSGQQGWQQQQSMDV